MLWYIWHAQTKKEQSEPCGIRIECRVYDFNHQAGEATLLGAEE